MKQVFIYGPVSLGAAAVTAQVDARILAFTLPLSARNDKLFLLFVGLTEDNFTSFINYFITNYCYVRYRGMRKYTL